MVVDREFGLERLGPECEALRERAEDLVAAYPAIVGEDVHDWPGLCDRLRSKDSLLHSAILARLPSRIQTMVSVASPSGLDEKQKFEILTAVNSQLCKQDLFDTSSDSEVCDVVALAHTDPIPALTKLRNHRYLAHLLRDQIVDRSDRTEAAERFFDTVLNARLRPPLGFRPRAFGQGSETAAPRNVFLWIKAMAGADQGKILQDLWDAVELRRQMDIEFGLHTLGRLWLLVHGPAACLLIIITTMHVWSSLRYGGL